jgi:hypothetical protein
MREPTTNHGAQRVFSPAAVALWLVAACSSSSPGATLAAGGSGKTGSGGSQPGGGAFGVGGGNGGASGGGGTAGVSGEDGSAAAGGRGTGGVGAAGRTSAGGTVGQGGGGAGGGSARGGSNGAGGALGSGGALSTGGTGPSGDAAIGSGGGTGSGGVSALGGAAAGGAARAGGTSGQGGATGRGGASGAGGTTITGPALAFPGAQGFGKKATGGRNGVVFHVTNLNDSGAGTFRDAVSTSNRIIVFDVGGYIQLKTAVGTKSNLTIAGQTAPGGGIGFRGGEISFANQSNIIMRHVRIRPGSETESTEDDALSLYLASTVIVDHSSMEFGPWNNIDGVGDTDKALVTDVTFQDSLIADPTGQQFGAHCESVGSDWAFYRNIFANSHNRNPLAKINNVFVNNLLYNYEAGYTTHTSTAFKHDLVNNYFVMGPSSGDTDNTWFQIDKNQSMYYSGNLKDSNKNGTLDGSTTTPYWYQGEGTVLSKPWSTETTASTPLDTPSAARVAMSRAGALPRDPIDALIIGQALSLGKGAAGGGAGSAGTIYTSQSQTGLDNNGYGTIAGGTKPADSDNDGMPDPWEIATGSDPKKDDAMTKASDGYALVEHYINWLAEPHASTTAGTSVDVDLAGLAEGFRTVSPTYTVSSAQNGTADLQADKHTARFQPSADFQGLASFSFTVTGSDNTKYTNSVAVLVAP